MLGHGIFRAARCVVCLAGILQDDVDFRYLEPGQFDLDVEIDQILELNRQKLLVPPGFLGELVIGQDVGALIRLAQMREPVGRHRGDAEELGGFHTAVTGDDLLVIIDQDRIAEAELRNAVRDLADLLLRMRPGIVRVRPQLANSYIVDFHVYPLFLRRKCFLAPNS